MLSNLVWVAWGCCALHHTEASEISSPHNAQAAALLRNFIQEGGCSSVLSALYSSWCWCCWCCCKATQLSSHALHATVDAYAKPPLSLCQLTTDEDVLQVFACSPATGLGSCPAQTMKWTGAPTVPVTTAPCTKHHHCFLFTALYPMVAVAASISCP